MVLIPESDFDQSEANSGQQQSVNAQYASDPNSPAIGAMLSAWGNVAPGIGGDTLLALAQSGVAPSDPVGQWIIHTGIPALTPRHGRLAKFLGDPQRLAAIAGLSPDQQNNILNATGGALRVSTYDPNQLSRLAQTGTPNVHHGLFDTAMSYVADVARPVFTGLQAGIETGEGLFRQGVAQTVATAHGEPATGVAGGFGPQPAHPYETKLPGGGTLETNLGPASDITGQTTLGQALQGKGLGQGFFPAGPAHAAAVARQQGAASIDGHALTPGRAAASLAWEPGSRPYQIMSGVVDATVAMKGDPASVLLGSLSTAVKGARVFAPTADSALYTAAHHLIDSANDARTMAALRAWAGHSEPGALHDAIVAKLRADPGSVQRLVADGTIDGPALTRAVGLPATGAFSGLRNMVDPPTALQWLNSQAGKDYAQFAADHGFTDIWHAGKSMPADVAAKLADASTPDDVRSVLGAEIATTMRNRPESVLPFGWRPNVPRLGQYLPKGYVDVADPNNAVTQAERQLALAKVPRGKWDGILKPIAEASNRGEMFDAYANGLGGALRKSLVDQGVDPDLAEKMTTFFGNDWEEARLTHVTAVGDTPHMPGLLVDGRPVPIVGPHVPSELLNSAIPPLDVRAIKQAVSRFAPIYRTPVVKGAEYLADSATNVFKIGALMKLALPVRFLMDEQARQATAGLDSMFQHPLSYIAWALGHKGEFDIQAQKFVEQLGDQQSAYARAIGSNYIRNESIFDPDSMLTKHSVSFRRGSSGYIRSWADNLSALHMDPVGRETARAIRDVGYAPAGVEGAGGVDAVKEWFWSGAGQKYRKDLAAAHLWRGESAYLANDRASADAYIDSVANRVQDAAGGHDDLINAVADGTPFDLTKATGRNRSVVDPQFRQTLHDLAAQEIGPEVVRGKATVTSYGARGTARKVVDKMMGALMDTPSQTLTRSPAFRQAYFKDVQRLMPHMDAASQDAAIANAAQGGVTLTKTGITGDLALADADKIAKAYGLADTRDLLYYPGERSTVMDNMRNVLPFGEAWKNIITNWAKLTAANPVVLRRVQQGVTAARESGFFHTQTDRQGNSTEVFTIIPANVDKLLTGLPWAETAPVRGLNLVGQGLPGFGPAVTIPAASFLPKVPVLHALEKFLLPYGSPDYNGGTFETFFPGWLTKLKASGFLAKYNIPFMGQSAQQKMVLSNVAKQAFDYFASTGNYDLSKPDDLQRLTQKSQDAAVKLYLLRGATQFAAPSAPNFDPNVKLKDGGIVELSKLQQDYSTMIQANQGDTYKATLAFVAKYGPERVFATQADTAPTIFGVPTTAEAETWKAQHPGFTSKYPNVFGFWGPSSGAFDYQAYLKAIQDGELKPLDIGQWSKLADARLGNAIYDQLRQRMPASPSDDDRAWLAKKKDAITKQYPGFNDASIKVTRADRPELIRELEGAVRDPAVRDDPLTHATAVYMEFRRRALESLAADGYRTASGISQAQSAQAVRDWLYEKGTYIATKIPEFTKLWNDVFQNEVAPKQVTSG